MIDSETAPWTEDPQEIRRVYLNVQSGSTLSPHSGFFEIEGSQTQETWSAITWLDLVQEAEIKSMTEEFRPVTWSDFVTSPASSTLTQDYPDTIDQEIELLFDRAKGEVFEDGMESEFSRGLVTYIKKYRNAAMEALERLILTEQVNAEIASETMRWLGHIDHLITYRHRLYLLERSLLNTSPRVRDGAGLGLASLDDPHAIPYLKKAIEREQIQELCHDLEQVLTQLETTYSASSVENDSESQVV